MFTANVVQFVNGNPANLAFDIFGTPVGPDYVDVDIDVSITHPFPGIHQYDGYDVRGVFMGSGSETLSYGSNLDYPSLVTDQHMKDYNPEGLDDEYMDPYDAPVGNPDGYTRWFNADEFIAPGVLGYLQGKLATPGYQDKLTATLNGYKYFCDGLDPESDAWEWLTDGTNADGHGLFSAGATNTRNYYLRFPVPTPGVAYGYAILATWGEPTANDDPADFVENAVEAVALSVDLTDSIYYVSDTDWGGDFIAEISPFIWEHAPSTILIETGVHSAVESFDPGTVLTGGTDTYSTYHVEFTVDDVTEAGYDEYWVILEYGEYDYTCDYPAPAPDATLAAFFRYDLYISDIPYNKDPVCDLELVSPTMPYEGWATLVEFDASGSTDPDGDPLTFSWDFDGDGTYGDPYEEGTDDNPSKMYDEDYTGPVWVLVEDDKGGETECSVEVDITAYAAKNIPLRSGVIARDIAIDHADGDLLIQYSDAQVWRYTEVDYYQTGAMLATSGTGAHFIDVSPNSYFICGGNRTSASYNRSFSPTGSPLGTHSNYTKCVEVAGFTTASYNNYHCSWTGFFWPDYIWINRYAPTGYSGGSGYIMTNATGSTRLHLDYVMGAEMASSSGGSYCYYVEGAPENRVEGYICYSLSSNGISWASGNNPLDISRDNTNYYYVLGTNASTSDPEIRKFNATGTSFGTFGDTSSISSDPLRIEGGDYDGNVFVLHGNSTDGYFVSIFFPDELTE